MELVVTNLWKQDTSPNQITNELQQQTKNVTLRLKRQTMTFRLVYVLLNYFFYQNIEIHVPKKHALFTEQMRPTSVSQVLIPEAPTTGKRLNAFPELKNEIVKKVLSELNPIRPLDGYERGEQTQPILFENGVVYHGEWKDSQKHGFGRLLQLDGSYYEGFFQCNEAHGLGRLIHANGDYYEGQWKNDQANGNGTYHRNKNNAVYSGNWINDKQYGYGKETWPDGSSYEGDYVDGKKNGKGIFKWAHGNIYSGEFLNNKMHGQGTYVWKTGKSYEGEWKDNRMEGKGIFKWPDGRTYNGDYLNDQKHGYGEFTWPDGRYYKGYWKEGKQHGKGVMKTADKEINGEWENGKQIIDQ